MALTGEALRAAVDDACTCGGGGPGDCCPACEVWHALRAALAGEGEDETCPACGTAGQHSDARCAVCRCWIAATGTIGPGPAAGR